MYKTTDGGSEWEQIDSYFNDAFDLKLNPKKSNIIYAGGSYYNNANSVMSVIKSINGGADWTRFSLSSEEGAVYSLAVSPGNPDVVYAAGYTYALSAYKGAVFRSQNAGAGWENISPPLVANNEYVYSIIVSPASDDIILAGTTNNVFKSINGGDSWTDLNAPFNSIRELRFNPKDANTVYAATYGSGVYISVDCGRSWSQINDGLLTHNMECLEVDHTNDYVYAGTRGSGIFRTDLITEIEEIDPELPVSAKLHANYPNPFNSSTTIEYEIPAAGSVSVKIFDLSGRLVQSLADRHHHQGSFTVKWDGRNLKGRQAASGVYLCVLKSISSEIVQKMVLIR